MAKDDIDFDAYMRDRGVQRLGTPASPTKPAAPVIVTSDPKLRAHVEALQRGHATALKELELVRGELEAAREGRDAAQRKLEAALAERNAAQRAREAALEERDAAQRGLEAARKERDAVAKERAALQRQLAAAPPTPPPARSLPTLREALLERGVDDETEAQELLLALLDRSLGALLDALEARSEFSERVLGRLTLVCSRAECQPAGPQAVVVRVSPERCEVCGGSDIRVAFDLLLRASRRAGVTRLVIVGGSPAYHTQLRDLARGTDLKLDLVAGHSKLGKRRARNEAERVVIWGATILDHGTSAAYEHLGDRLVRVPHRGISRMLREVAAALEAGIE